MNPLPMPGALANLDLAVEYFGWCFVQVTVFAIVVAATYRFTRWQRASRNVVLLAAGLTIVGLLTLASVSPWPRWSLTDTAAVDLSHDDPLLWADDSEARIDRWQTADADVEPGWDRAARGAAQSVPSTTAAAHAVVPPGDAVGLPWWHSLVAVAWIAAVFGLLRLLVGLVYLGRHRRLSRPIDDPPMRRWFDQLRDRLGVTASVELRESASLEVAATIGWRRPLILLPATWHDWTPDQSRAVLAHELAHVAERHVPEWLVSQVATVPHFYHPLVHWLGRRLRLEQELAADQLAARTFGSRCRYADALAALALGRVRSAGPLSALGLFMSRPLLMRRIAMLRQPSHRPRRVSRFTHLVALALVVLTAVGVAGLRANTPATEELSDTTPAATDTSTPAAYDNLRVEEESAATSAEPAKSAPGPIPARGREAKESTREVMALLQVPSESGNLFNRSGGAQSWRIYSRTQAALLSSEFVLHNALKTPEVEKLPLVAARRVPMVWLRKGLDVGFLPDTELMYVKMKGGPDEVEQLRTIVDTVIKTYLDEFVSAEDRRRSDLRDALAKSLHNVNHEITQKMEDYFALAKELGAADAFRQDDPERTLVLNEITEMLRAKTELERHVAELQTNFLVTRQRWKDFPAIGRTTEERLADDLNMAMLQQQLMQLQMQLAEEGSKIRSIEHLPRPAYIRRQIEEVERQIEQLREQLKLAAGSGRGEPAGDAEAATREFELRSSLLRKRISELEGAIAEKSEELKKTEQSVDLRIKAAELEQLQEIARDMSIRIGEIGVEASVPHERVRVIQWAM